jgi:hypothetical protein
MVCGDVGDKSRCCAGYSVIGAMFTVSGVVMNVPVNVPVLLCLLGLSRLTFLLLSFSFVFASPMLLVICSSHVEFATLFH